MYGLKISFWKIYNAWKNYPNHGFNMREISTSNIGRNEK